MFEGRQHTSTVAELIARIGHEAAMPEKRRRDWCSALRQLCELIEADPLVVVAEADAIERHLRRIRTMETGRQRKTVQNLASNVRAAIRHVGIRPLRRTAKTSLTPAWQSLYCRLPESRLRGLFPLLRFCSERGFGPNEVSDATVTEFISVVAATGAAPKAKQLHRRSTVLWNEAVDRTPDWPQRRLSVPDYRKPPEHTCWSDLPVGLGDDIDTYLDWLGGRTFLEDDGPRHVCKPSTLTLRRRQLHGAASMALKAGIAPSSLVSLAALTNAATVKALLTAYHQKNGGKVTQYMIDLGEALLSVAKVWVEADAENLDRLRGYVRRLGPPRAGMTEKNRTLIRKFNDPHRLSRLLHAPERLIEEARKASLGSRHAAVLAQLAVFVGIAQMAPMRIGNLVALRLDRHVARPGGRDTTYVLEIPGSETKNGEAHHYPLPARTSKLLDDYLAIYRPALATKDCPWLFPGENGLHKHQSTARQQIVDQISRLVGVDMTPHQFRHLAAKLYLDRNPGQFEVVRRFLGHKSVKTTISFYAELSTERATRLLDDLIDDLHSKLPRSQTEDHNSYA